ncbi:hypothetical protein NX059_010468 [Plenodomus lindquistii]|nr:hypothetical protein NX059_010468 [Plenodomus lindquistii]
MINIHQFGGAPQALRCGLLKLVLSEELDYSAVWTKGSKAWTYLYDVCSQAFVMQRPLFLSKRSSNHVVFFLFVKPRSECNPPQNKVFVTMPPVNELCPI